MVRRHFAGSGLARPLQDSQHMATRPRKLKLARETLRNLTLSGQAQRVVRVTPAVALTVGAAAVLAGCGPTDTCVCTIGH